MGGWGWAKVYLLPRPVMLKLVLALPAPGNAEVGDQDKFFAQTDRAAGFAGLVVGFVLQNDIDQVAREAA